jgi:hypothetical protein
MLPVQLQGTEEKQTMRLSEAILLGSTVVSPQAGGQFFSQTQAGCALGMAAIARGCTFGPAIKHFDEKNRRTLGTEKVWGNWVLLEIERPCNCWRFRAPRKMRIKDIIAHLFDYHIVEKKNWTLENLAAWVETVEPKVVHTEEIPRPTPKEQWSSVVEAMELRAEASEWRSVRESFEARNRSRHKRVRPSA